MPSKAVPQLDDKANTIKSERVPTGQEADQSPGSSPLMIDTPPTSPGANVESSGRGSGQAEGS